MNIRRILLEQYRSYRNVPFAWGESDCLHFAAACAQAITGRDPIDRLRGSYDSEHGAKRVMVENGWEDMGDVAASFYPEIPLARAKSGDWVTVEQDGRIALGVVVAENIAVKSIEGTGWLPLRDAKRAFQVTG